ncbi:uncharacterized protein LOC116845812 [Odontomachus brunneus]|uniref:uncharacterized protein LOC116845812 n=1 Tax=Odontomachus brunneus TaxID=486640 RepID=UPI0013F1F32A|nr:uncharacterized protein LOC116845812 [Odontomachus brunneus]
MKLHAAVIVLLCVVAYTIAENEKYQWSTSYSLPYRRDTDVQNSIAANVNEEEVPQLLIDATINKYLLDNEDTSNDLIETASVASGSEPQLNGQLNILHKIDEEDLLRVYGDLEPSDYSSHNSELSGIFRFRREADPQNSINFHGTQPLSGPNRQPSWDLNFNRNIHNNDRMRTDVFGGVSKVPGQRAQPHVGIQAERNIGKNGFIRGSGQLQPGRGGHGVSPSFGVSTGVRFRREWDLNFNRNIHNNDRMRTDVFGGVSKVPGQRAQPHVGIQAERNIGKNGFIRGSGQLQPGRGGHGVSPSFGVSTGVRFRREADPQNSINFQGTQPLSGPNRQPTWDLNFNRNIHNNDRMRTDVFGGVSKVPGQRAQPHVGIQAERNFGNNGFIRGSGQLQPGRGGHRVSPSFGITGGFRFRREAETQFA